MKIWAHRGCSLRYPENTIPAFQKAMDLKGLTGIELDIQLTRDGHIIVMHDERVDRTTDGIGELRSFTLSELKRLRINAGNGKAVQIPTLEEVLDLLGDRLKRKFILNIELKNSIFPYPGMEEKVVSLIRKRQLQNSVVYSSFSALSLEKIRKLDDKAELGILDHNVSDCLYKLKGGCGATALHPFWKAIDLPGEQLADYPVRAWFTGYLYPERPTGVRLDLERLEQIGITDVFLNEPEMYANAGN